MHEDPALSTTRFSPAHAMSAQRGESGVACAFYDHGDRSTCVVKFAQKPPWGHGQARPVLGHDAAADDHRRSRRSTWPSSRS